MTREEAASIRLSRNFTLWELIYSAKATEYGLLDKQLEIPELYILNLRRLCQNILQPLRDDLKCPIKINSGTGAQNLTPTRLSWGVKRAITCMARRQIYTSQVGCRKRSG